MYVMCVTCIAVADNRVVSLAGVNWSGLDIMYVAKNVEPLAVIILSTFKYVRYKNKYKDMACVATLDEYAS